jgi:hypothetical protein
MDTEVVMDAAAAQTQWEAALGRPVAATLLYQTETAFPGGARRVLLLGAMLDHDDSGSEVFHVCAVAEGLAPWWSAAPNWETTRRGKREREISLLRLYVGKTLYDLRRPGPPTAQLLAQAEHKRQLIARSAYVVQVDLVEVIYIPGHGGSQMTFRVVPASGALQFRNQEGRAHQPNPRVLQVIATHPTWYFLGLRFQG